MELFTSVSTLFFQPISISFLVILGLIVFAFFAGYLLRAMRKNKAQNRILQLEDEMLRNHAKILSLEKNVSDLKKENTQLRNNQTRRPQEPKLQS